MTPPASWPHRALLGQRALGAHEMNSNNTQVAGRTGHDESGSWRRVTNYFAEIRHSGVSAGSNLPLFGQGLDLLRRHPEQLAEHVFVVLAIARRAAIDP